MKRLISFPLESGGIVQVEVEEETGLPATRGLHPVDVVETVANSFEAALDAIKPAAVAMASIFRNIVDAPDVVEVEFGVKFAGQRERSSPPPAAKHNSASRWFGRTKRRRDLT